jgi:hypothetical protein
MGAINGDGDRLPGQEFGLSTAPWYQTGMGGTPGTAGMEAPPLARVTVTPLFQSSQVPPDPAVVSIGDTFSSSSDSAVVESPLLPGSSYASVTGIGHGRPRSSP